MSEKLIAKINGVEILTVEQDGEVFAPVKPICNAMGISYTGQLEKLKNDPTFSESVVRLSRITGADGKEYEMICLPLLLVFLWLGSINPKNVSDEARPNVMRYRLECAHVLYEHFTGAMARIEESNQRERELLAEVDAAASEEKEARARRKRAEDDLEKYRAERLNPQPSLF